jgi:hypothetical protein
MEGDLKARLVSDGSFIGEEVDLRRLGRGGRRVGSQRRGRDRQLVGKRIDDLGDLEVAHAANSFVLRAEVFLPRLSRERARDVKRMCHNRSLAELGVPEEARQGLCMWRSYPTPHPLKLSQRLQQDRGSRLRIQPGRETRGRGREGGAGLTSRYSSAFLTLWLRVFEKQSMEVSPRRHFPK